jgi:hypothetical protein
MRLLPALRPAWLAFSGSLAKFPEPPPRNFSDSSRDPWEPCCDCCPPFLPAASPTGSSYSENARTPGGEGGH